MSRSMKSVWLSCAVLLLTFALQEGRAAACTYRCLEVPDPNPYCQRCINVGYFTNETCVNSGSCACLDVPNDCFFLAAAAPNAESLEAAIFGPETKAISTASGAGSPILGVPALQR